MHNLISMFPQHLFIDLSVSLFPLKYCQQDSIPGFWWILGMHMTQGVFVQSISTGTLD